MAWWRGSAIEAQPVDREIVENALIASGARLVALARYDAEQRRARSVGWAGLDSEPIRRGLEVVRRTLPRFDPERIAVAADVNPTHAAVYLRGESVSVPLAEHALGVVDPLVVEAARSVSGIEHVYHCPLKVEGQVAGSLAFLTHAAPTESQRRVDEAFARQVGLTWENDRLLHLLQRNVEELEESRRRITTADDRLRREIAELLHSRVLTRLLVVWTRLGQCADRIAVDPAAAAEMLRQVRADVDQIGEREIRRAVYLLHPSVIRVGLVPAVRSLLTRFEESLASELRVDPAVAELDDAANNRIPEPLRLAMYRVLEEAINNVYRHANAGRVEVELGLAGPSLSLLVRDDGCGFDPSAARRGLGLGIVGDRVDQAGGSWSVASALGRGTTLRALFPLGGGGEPPPARGPIPQSS
ncbi:MAG TPA: ATP-binding protein [Chloroflexota bacterium]